MLNQKPVAEIKYQYAYDETGKLVSINDYTKEESKLHTFRCVGCGNPLLPRAIGSTSRRPHFYHKEVVECSGETYVHKLAKKLLKEKFDNSEEFLVAYPVSKNCNNKNCRLRNINCKREHEKATIDLKKYYDTCTEEVGVEGFVADLLLTKSDKPELVPVLLEICVTHACEEEKVASGLKIIELKVKKEQDVIAMVERKVLEELAYSPEREKDVKFISFKRNMEEPLVTDVVRFIFHPWTCENGFITKIDCSRADRKLLTDSLCELNMVNTQNYAIPTHWNAMEWMAIHKNLRRCNLCKFYYSTMYEHTPICRLSKKYGKPMFPKMTEAETCRSFQFDERKNTFEINQNDLTVEEVIALPAEQKDTYRVIIAGSRAFYDKDVFDKNCDLYLGEKMKTHNVVIISGTARDTEHLISGYAREHSLLIEPHEADWERYGQSAALASNDKMLEHADALIAFWDGKGLNTGALIEAAQAKGIKVAVVKYDAKDYARIDSWEEDEIDEIEEN